MKPFRGISQNFFQIATYIKNEHIKRFGSNLQEATREAIRRVLLMKEEDLLTVPEEVIEDTLKDAVWKIIYTNDEELYRKWKDFPRQYKKQLHYWINQHLDTIELQEKNEEHSNTLAFYLFGKVKELYKEGFINSRTVLSVLEELYEKQDEIKPLRKKEYMQFEKKLNGSVKVLVNFKDREDLRDWYATLPIELKRGVWIKAHEKLLDKLTDLWYNILHQNL